MSSKKQKSPLDKKIDFQKHYDEKTAHRYDEDAFGILQKTLSVVLNQIRRHLGTKAAPVILDLGCGTGSMLLTLLRQFPDALVHGIELSPGMLKLADQKLRKAGFTARLTVGDIQQIEQHTEAGAHDLACCHFVLSCVQATPMLGGVFRSLRSGGLFSVLTTTYDSFPNVQAFAASLLTPEQLRALAPVPHDHDHAAHLLRDSGFEVLEQERIEVPVHFDDFAALEHFGVVQGWFAPFFEPFTPEQRAIFAQMTTHRFPIDDMFRGTALLARKP
jgi:ubiquinone/menaquinone biosynthesis C-methylase UbiE